MATNSVSWFEIYVNDMPRAKGFYETVLERKLEKLPTDFDMWVFPGDMNTYGTAGALVHTPEMPAGQNSVVVYFECEDCAVEEGRVAQAGGQVKQSKMSIGEHGFISLVTDTEGNLIGLHSMQ
jgi:hypothetical protein